MTNAFWHILAGTSLLLLTLLFSIYFMSIDYYADQFPDNFEIQARGQIKHWLLAGLFIWGDFGGNDRQMV